MSMTVSQTCDSLLDHLCLTPDDWELRSVWADALEDAGRQAESDCVRWCVRRRKRPRQYRPYTGETEKRAQWYNELQTGGQYDVESDLPSKLYSKLGGEFHKRSDARTDYLSPRDAELALLAAWPLALADGFDPDAYVPKEFNECPE